MIGIELPASKTMLCSLNDGEFFPVCMCVNRDLVSHMAVCVCLFYPELQSPQGGLLLKSCNE